MHVHSDPPLKHPWRARGRPGQDPSEGEAAGDPRASAKGRQRWAWVRQQRYTHDVASVQTTIDKEVGAVDVARVVRSDYVHQRLFGESVGTN